MRRAVSLVLVALALAVGALAQDAGTAPPPLALEHQDLVGRLHTAVRDGTITYTPERIVIRGHVGAWPARFAVHVEATLARVDGRVRLHVEDLLVSGRPMPGRKREAEARLARLIDEETEAEAVRIRDGDAVVYAQDL